jgi:hypothetical protein
VAVLERFEESQHEEDEDLKAIDPSELVRKEWSTAMEPHSDLVLPMLPYQKEGLAWMYNQVTCACFLPLLVCRA